MSGFDYTVKGSDKGLTYIFRDEANKYNGFDESKVDWQKVMTVFDKIQAEKQKSGGSIFTGSQDKTSAGYGSSYVIKENDKIELTEAELKEIYTAMGVDVSKGKKPDAEETDPNTPEGMRTTAQSGVYYDPKTKKHYKNDSSGKPVEMKPVQDGAVITQVNEDGSHFERCKYENGNYSVDLFDKDGKIKSYVYYDSNKKKISETIYNDKGQKIFERDYETGRYSRFHYHPNGKLKTEDVYNNSNKKWVKTTNLDANGNFVNGKSPKETWVYKKLSNGKEICVITDRKTKAVHYETYDDSTGKWVNCTVKGTISP